MDISRLPASGNVENTGNIWQQVWHDLTRPNFPDSPIKWLRPNQPQLEPFAPLTQPNALSDAAGMGDLNRWLMHNPQNAALAGALRERQRQLQLQNEFQQRWQQQQGQ